MRQRRRNGYGAKKSRSDFANRGEGKREKRNALFCNIGGKKDKEGNLAGYKKDAHYRFSGIVRNGKREMGRKVWKV